MKNFPFIKSYTTITVYCLMQERTRISIQKWQKTHMEVYRKQKAENSFE